MNSLSKIHFFFSARFFPYNHNYIHMIPRMAVCVLYGGNWPLYLYMNKKMNCRKNIKCLNYRPNVCKNKPVINLNVEKTLCQMWSPRSSENIRTQMRQKIRHCENNASLHAKRLTLVWYRKILIWWSDIRLSFVSSKKDAVENLFLFLTFNGH